MNSTTQTMAVLGGDPARSARIAAGTRQRGGRSGQYRQNHMPLSRPRRNNALRIGAVALALVVMVGIAVEASAATSPFGIATPRFHRRLRWTLGAGLRVDCGAAGGILPDADRRAFRDQRRRPCGVAPASGQLRLWRFSRCRAGTRQGGDQRLCRVVGRDGAAQRRDFLRRRFRSSPDRDCDRFGGGDRLSGHRAVHDARD